jgi:hypothetical protein
MLSVSLRNYVVWIERISSRKKRLNHAEAEARSFLLLTSEGKGNVADGIEPELPPLSGREFPQ